MTHYVIGDIQGCLSGLKKLLDVLHFSESDQVYFVGDLVNRGPDSLETLRFIRSLPHATTVLGNHDIHLLAVYFKARAVRPKDTLDPLLTAPDAPLLIDWLRKKPLAIYLKSFDSLIVHAGIHPHWTLQQVLSYAEEIHHLLISPGIEENLRTLFGNEPRIWQEHLTGTDRLRCLINYFTRMRFCKEDGTLDFAYKGAPPHSEIQFKPWFDYPLATQQKILFGHWATLAGGTNNPRIIALDTGYIWGNTLTAIRLEDGQYFQIT